jgi:hypothetical protein
MEATGNLSSQRALLGLKRSSCANSPRSIRASDRAKQAPPGALRRRRIALRCASRAQYDTIAVIPCSQDRLCTFALHDSAAGLLDRTFCHRQEQFGEKTSNSLRMTSARAAVALREFTTFT